MKTERTDDNGNVFVFKFGNDLTTYKSRLKETNLFHSFNGKPAVIDRWGRYWYVNGKRHRKDGPAVVEYVNGHKEWYINGKRHREDGPAVEWADGYKAWYINGKRHRKDGPAVEYTNGDKGWYINGNYLTEQEFNEWRKNNADK
jgi:hypothetical protein